MNINSASRVTTQSAPARPGDAGPPVTEDDRVGITGGGTRVDVRTDPKTAGARHQVRVAVGEDDHVPRRQLDLFLADYAGVASALGQNMVGDEVLGPRHDPRPKLPRGYRLDAPRLRRLDAVEERAVETDDTQQVRKCIHHPGSLGRLARM